ncbi:transposase, partial [Ursidibacter sp. B-7004-1]
YKSLTHIFENEPKNCPYCQNTVIHKHVLKNNIQRYKCPSCNKTFTLQKKLNYSDIWQDYSQGKQTYKELAIKYKCSVKTIQRYIDKAPKTALKMLISMRLIIMDR